MKKLFIALVIFFIAIFFLLNNTFSDVQINKYTNLEGVKENAAIQRGWIPAILPGSAYDIVETHDLDTNMIFGSFKYKEKDEETFMQNLTEVSDANTSEWGNFLFKVDQKVNQVQFRNKVPLTQ